MYPDRPKITDIAEMANVSTATVDRVLNLRPGVSNKTLQKVKFAVQKLGYRELHPSLRDKAKGTVSVAYILPKADSDFVRALHKCVEAQIDRLPSVDLQSSIYSVVMNTGDNLSKQLADLNPDDHDAVCLFGIDTADVRTEIDSLRMAGCRVATIVSDVPNTKRDYFVGTDNIAAGATAARLLGRFSCAEPCDVAVISSSMLHIDQRERYLGFRDLMAKQFRHISVLPVCENFADPDQSKKIVEDLFKNRPKLKGVYSAGGGNQAIRCAFQKYAPHSVDLVQHELTRDSRTGLLDGTVSTVLNQCPYKIIDQATDLLCSIVLGSENSPENRSIPVDILLAENFMTIPAAEMIS